MSLPTGWVRTGKYFLEHISGKWRISRSSVKGEWCYTLWCKSLEADGRAAHWGLFGNHASVDDADKAMKTRPAVRLKQRGSK